MPAGDKAWSCPPAGGGRPRPSGPSISAGRPTVRRRPMNDVPRPPKLNPREELVALLRGHAACPILSGLGEHGLLDRMLEGPFTATDFPEVAEPGLFAAALTYFVSLGLLR